MTATVDQPPTMPETPCAKKHKKAKKATCAKKVKKAPKTKKVIHRHVVNLKTGKHEDTVRKVESKH